MSATATGDARTNQISMLKLCFTYAYNILAIWQVHTVGAAAFSMLIRLHPECLFATQSGSAGSHSRFADAAFCCSESNYAQFMAVFVDRVVKSDSI